MEHAIDETNTDPRYWEEVLRREGLAMARGKRENRVTYRGTSNELGVAEERQEARRRGYRRMPGHGPDE